MKHASSISLIFVAGILALSGHLPFVGSNQAAAQTAPTLQFVKNIWQNSRYGQNGEERFPGLTFWLSDGYFVVTDGWCTHQTEKGGFKVFREDGTFIGEANTCTDSLAPGEDQNKLSLWSHVWGTGNENYAIIDGNSFVVGGQAGSSWKYPPKVYSVNSSGVSLDGAAWKLLLEDDDSDPPRLYTRDDAPNAEGYGVIGNSVVAQVTAGSRSARPHVVIYSIPSLSITNEDTQGLRIFAHVGSYIIAQSGNAAGPVGLYRLTSEGKLASAQTLLSGEHNITPALSWRGGFRDPLDPTRFALREARNSRTTSSRGDIHIYKLEGDKATEMATRETLSGSRTQDPFALFGEYVIYGTCSDNENDRSRTEASGSCKLILDNNGVIAEADLPRDIEEGASISGISVSRSGRIMVIANANAYLYQIGGVVPPPGSPILPPLTPTQAGSMADLMRAYVQLIDTFVNSH